MKRWIVSILMVLPMTLLAACGQPSTPNEPAAASETAEVTATQADTAAPVDEQTPAPIGPAGPALKPGGGLVAEESGVEGNLAINIRWSAEMVTGIPAEGLTTTVYDRSAQLLCPVTSSGESAASYFAAFDNPDGDPFAATGAYQPWWNEDCTGTLTINDTYHADDPTIAGPEPVVHTAGTRPLSTAATPLTVETDLNGARTRYLFITPSTDGFAQEAVEGYEAAKFVAASATPMATMDITREGPIGDGREEIAVHGGTVQVDWTFTRGRTNP